MSFGSRSNCLQALQTCCDTPFLFGKDIPRLNFLFGFRSGGGGVGVDGKK